MGLIERGNNVIQIILNKDYGHAEINCVVSQRKTMVYSSDNNQLETKRCSGVVNKGGENMKSRVIHIIGRKVERLAYNQTVSDLSLSTTRLLLNTQTMAYPVWLFVTGY